MPIPKEHHRVFLRHGQQAVVIYTSKVEWGERGGEKALIFSDAKGREVSVWFAREIVGYADPESYSKTINTAVPPKRKP